MHSKFGLFQMSSLSLCAALSKVNFVVYYNYLNGFQILVLCFCGFFTILTAKRLRPDRLDCCGYWMSCLDVVSVITELNFGPRWSKVQAAITSVV